MPESAISNHGWSMESFSSHRGKFRTPRIVSVDMPNLEVFLKTHRSEPLVITGFHELPSWEAQTFNAEDFMRRMLVLPVRNVHNWTDSTMNAAEFFAISREMPHTVASNEMKRLYGKDVECPDNWRSWLMKEGTVPEWLCPHAQENILAESPKRKLETLMCYVGVGDTATPAHKDLCASTGQNLMMYTEKGGSSFWFMTSTESSADASEYFAKELGHILDHETHFVSLPELAKADFPIYVWEQKLGDLIVIPPRSCHQVVNNGGITIKMSWSRMLLQDLPAALYVELPLYQRVCRRETYAIKAVIRECLTDRTRMLKGVSQGQRSSTASAPPNSAVAEELQLLVFLYQVILDEEEPLLTSTGDVSPDVQVENDEEAGGLFCDFCGADVFNAFFECQSCTPIHDSCEAEPSFDESYCLCPRCYVDGRRCPCGGSMEPRLMREPSILRAELASALGALSRYMGKNSAESLQAPLLKYKPRNTAPIFQAGCELYDRRQGDQPSRTCNIGRSRSQEKNHIRPASSIIICKQCHRGICLKHILEVWRIHAAEALLRHADDKTSVSWHSRHKKAKPDVIMKCSMEENTAKAAGMAPPDGLFSLAQSARLLKHCKPLSNKYTLGWYDTLSIPRPRARIVIRSDAAMKQHNSHEDELQSKLDEIREASTAQWNSRRNLNETDGESSSLQDRTTSSSDIRGGKRKMSSSDSIGSLRSKHRRP